MQRSKRKQKDVTRTKDKLQGLVGWLVQGEGTKITIFQPNCNWSCLEIGWMTRVYDVIDEVRLGGVYMRVWVSADLSMC